MKDVEVDECVNDFVVLIVENTEVQPLIVCVVGGSLGTTELDIAHCKEIDIPKLKTPHQRDKGSPKDW